MSTTTSPTLQPDYRSPTLRKNLAITFLTLTCPGCSCTSTSTPTTSPSTRGLKPGNEVASNAIMHLRPQRNPRFLVSS